MPRVVVTRALIACSVLAILFGARGAGAPLPAARLVAASPFVSVSGGELYRNGAPWRFTGYDAFRLTSDSPGFQCGGVLSDQQLDTIFAEMTQSSGAVAVRTWFFQSYGGPARWDQYDRVLAAAAAHGVEVIPVLVNEWRECEPSSGEKYRNVSWYEQGYTQPDDGYSLSFRDFAIAMARHYANNPTIAFWQIVNEAEARDSHGGSCEESRAAHALRSFADDVAGAMKAVDPNHLINLGTMGGGQCGTLQSDYEYVNGGDTDICELHDYSHQIVMGNQWNGTVPDINGCAQMGKPLFAGEVGIDASVQPDWSASGSVTAETLARRAGLFAQKMEALFALGADGFLIWGKSLQPSQHWWVGPVDPTQAVMLAEQRALDGGATGGGAASLTSRPGSAATDGGAHALQSAGPAGRLQAAAHGIGASLAALMDAQLTVQPQTEWARRRLR